MRAKFDYSPRDATEIGFAHGNLFAVTGQSQDDKWWNAILWDEVHNCSTGRGGCIPENYVDILT